MGLSHPQISVTIDSELVESEGSTLIQVSETDLELLFSIPIFNSILRKWLASFERIASKHFITKQTRPAVANISMFRKKTFQVNTKILTFFF